LLLDKKVLYPVVNKNLSDNKTLNKSFNKEGKVSKSVVLLEFLF
jgi:hypothetical protein